MKISSSQFLSLEIRNVCQFFLGMLTKNVHHISFQGITKGVSQSCARPLPDGRFVWNFPFEFVLKSTNPFGWPRLVLEVDTPNYLGQEITTGYSNVIIPTTPGR